MLSTKPGQVQSGDHTIIADAKFYKKTLWGGRYGEKLRSQHLYQLLTYLSHAQLHVGSAKVSGLLIYPQVGPTLRLHYELIGFPVTIVTVDLSKEWQAIHQELIDLLAAAGPRALHE
jgi:5-methylcytosine-specific restriction enzyme subunit McrC